MTWKQFTRLKPGAYICDNFKDALPTDDKRVWIMRPTVEGIPSCQYVGRIRNGNFYYEDNGPCYSMVDRNVGHLRKVSKLELLVLML